MALFRRSLAEDDVDRYNHTWSVMLLLLLSLIALLLPLSPVIDSLAATSPTPAMTSYATSPPPRIPVYRASCWIPNVFSGAHALYTNVHCALIFNKAIEAAVNNDSSSERIGLTTSIDQVSHKQYKPNVTIENELLPGSELPKLGNTKIGKVKTRTFIYLTAPLALFLLALGMKLPHILWRLCKGCQTFSVDKTLNQKRNQSVKISSCSASVGYLFFKLLMVIAVILELAVVMVVLLPQIDDVNKELDMYSQNTVMPVRQSQPFVKVHNDGGLVFCEMDIILLNNIQKYSLQCVFSIITVQPDDSVASPAQVRETPGHQDVDNKASMEIYRAVFTAVLAYLIILAITNILSTISWLARLVLGCCRSGQGSKPSMDAILLDQMNRENAACLATNDLMDSCAAVNEELAGKLLKSDN